MKTLTLLVTLLIATGAAMALSNFRVDTTYTPAEMANGAYAACVTEDGTFFVLATNSGGTGREIRKFNDTFTLLDTFDPSYGYGYVSMAANDSSFYMSDRLNYTYPEYGRIRKYSAATGTVEATYLFAPRSARRAAKVMIEYDRATDIVWALALYSDDELVVAKLDENLNLITSAVFSTQEIECASQDATHLYYYTRHYWYTVNKTTLAKSLSYNKALLYDDVTSAAELSDSGKWQNAQYTANQGDIGMGGIYVRGNGKTDGTDYNALLIVSYAGKSATGDPTALMIAPHNDLMYLFTSKKIFVLNTSSALQVDAPLDSRFGTHHYAYEVDGTIYHRYSDVAGGALSSPVSVVAGSLPAIVVLPDRRLKLHYHDGAGALQDKTSKDRGGNWS